MVSILLRAHTANSAKIAVVSLRYLCLLVVMSVQMVSILFAAHTANSAKFAAEDLWLSTLFRRWLWIYSYTIYCFTLVIHRRWLKRRSAALLLFEINIRFGSFICYARLFLDIIGRLHLARISNV